jgi:hypothetical protein
MASPLNPAAVTVVTYLYQFCLPLSEQPKPPTRPKAQGLLSGSCTLGTMGHWLWSKNLYMICSLQLQCRNSIIHQF